MGCHHGGFADSGQEGNGCGRGANCANDLRAWRPARLLAASSSNEDFTKENVMSTMAVLKQRENVRQLTAYLKSAVPPLYTALIAELSRGNLETLGLSNNSLEGACECLCSTRPTKANRAPPF